MKKIIHHDQVGFVPRLQAPHMHESVSVMGHIHGMKDGNHESLSVSTESVFDKVQLSFVLISKIGIQGRFLDIIRTSVKSPQ